MTTKKPKRAREKEPQKPKHAGGRPPFVVGEVKDRIFSMRFSDDERALLDAAASRKGVTAAEFVRKAVADAARLVLARAPLGEK